MISSSCVVFLHSVFLSSCCACHHLSIVISAESLCGSSCFVTMEAWVKRVRFLRNEVDELLAARRRLKMRKTRMHDLPVHVRAACLLVLLMSNSSQLAMLYLLKYVESYKLYLLADDTLWDMTTWMAWLSAKPVLAVLFSCLGKSRHAILIDVNDWLLESLVAESIHKQNMKGVVVPHRDVLLYFIRFGSFLHDCDNTVLRLRRIFTQNEYSRQWGRGFRQRWNLDWNNLPQAKKLDGDLLKDRVLHLHFLLFVVSHVMS